MKIKKQFLLFFITFIFIIVLITGIISIIYLRNSFDILINCTNPELIPVMAKRMYLKFLIGFSVTLFLITGISIPVGLYLSKIISKPYLDILLKLNNIGKKRLKVDSTENISNNELDTLENFSEILIDDFEKMKEYEKVKSWKNGARLLIHELKNPLTPLKLSTQKIYVQNNNKDNDKNDIKRILTAVSDIENILRCFKDLVNIEFAPKKTINIIAEIENIINDYDFEIKIDKKHHYKEFFVSAEIALLKMLFLNLIKNGMEANKDDFYISIEKNDSFLSTVFITPNIEIKDISKVFKLGYSEKGNNRGFGLFLCKNISDYIDLDLSCANTERGVEFSINFKNVQKEY